MMNSHDPDILKCVVGGFAVGPSRGRAGLGRTIGLGMVRQFSRGNEGLALFGSMLLFSSSTSLQ